MFNQQTVIRRQAESSIAVNQVLRNTYWLLGLSIIVSACTAWLTMAFNLAGPGILTYIVGIIGLSYLTRALAHTAWGIAAVFLFTAFLGYALGPLLNAIIGNFINGTQIVATAFSATGLIFFSLSAYALTTQKDFSYMGGFLFAGVMSAFLLGLAGIIFQLPLLNLVISFVFTLLSSGLILFHTSSIIHGGERNYILATISIFVALFNLFVNLLHIFATFAGSRD